MRRAAFFAFCAILLTLSGCEGAFDPFQRPGNWSATGAANETIAQQVAVPSDLISGRGNPYSNGVAASAALDKALGPGGVVGAEEPESVELLAGGFERTHDLDGGVVGLGSEDGFASVRVELVEEIGPGVEGGVEVEEREVVEEALPSLEGLEGDGVGRALAGPGGAIEEMVNEVGPN